jgi:hypothetical protein
MAAARKAPKRIIAVHADSHAMTTPTRAALVQLGYDLRDVDPSIHGSPAEPDLRIVDERRIDEIPAVEDDKHTPIVLLTGVRPITLADRQRDPRIVGRIARPAGLTPLYGLLQQGLEPTPRRVPRVETRLPARWIRSERLTIGSITSLSERGCLLRTAQQRLERGARMQVQFALPGAGLLSLAADCVHGTNNDVGLCFHEPAASIRNAIGGFVNDLLAAR